MIDIDKIRKNPDEARQMVTDRNMDSGIIDKFLVIDEKWRNLQTEVQELQRKQKELSATKNIEEAKKNKEAIKEKEAQIKEIEGERYERLLEIPNFPFDDVPRGKDESENKVIKTVGKPPEFKFIPKDHLELGESLGIIDVKTASEVAGSRFYYLRGAGALLERALLQYALDTLVEAGFEPVVPPIMIKPEVYKKMGRLAESQKEERYYLNQDDLYLVGSSEHTMGPLGMNKIFEAKELPTRFTASTPCFRREAGSYGKDVKGILRVHQFDKVEMYSFVDPEKSEEEQKFMLNVQENILKGLDIPYQVVEICTGDMGPTDARQFDIEVWVPTQNKYREATSCSNTTDYQTRGIGAKIRKGGNTEYAHALNATGITPRTMIAIMENFQQKDGSIEIPKALRKYTGFKKISVCK